MRDTLRVAIRWEWLFLLALIPIALFPDSWRSLVLLVIPLLWLVRKFATGRFVPATPYDVSILFLLVMVLVSFTATFDIALSFPKIAGILLGVALFYGALSYADSHRNGVWHITAFIFVVGALMALVGIIGSQWSPPFDFLNQGRYLLPLNINQFPGTVDGIVNANELAGTLGWVAPLMIACLVGLWRPLWDRNQPLLVLLVLATAFITLVLLATLSRGGILAFVVGLAFVLGLYAQARWRLVLVVLLLLGALVLFFSYRDPQTGLNITGDALGMQGRLEIWTRALHGIADYPLTGMSVNGFRRVVHVLYPLFLTSSDIDLAHAHNHLLQAGLDLGIPGLIAYLSLWLVSAALLWTSWRHLRKVTSAPDHPYFALIIGLSGSLLAGWVFGIFDAIALGSRPGFVWWVILALVAIVHQSVLEGDAAFRRRRRRRQPQTEEPEHNTPAGQIT